MDNKIPSFEEILKVIIDITDIKIETTGQFDRKAISRYLNSNYDEIDFEKWILIHNALFKKIESIFEFYELKWITHLIYKMNIDWKIFYNSLVPLELNKKELLWILIQNYFVPLIIVNILSNYLKNDTYQWLRFFTEKISKENNLKFSFLIDKFLSDLGFTSELSFILKIVEISKESDFHFDEDNLKRYFQRWKNDDSIISNDILVHLSNYIEKMYPYNPAITIPNLKSIFLVYKIFKLLLIKINNYFGKDKTIDITNQLTILYNYYEEVFTTKSFIDNNNLAIHCFNNYLKDNYFPLLNKIQHDIRIISNEKADNEEYFLLLKSIWEKCSPNRHKQYGEKNEIENLFSRLKEISNPAFQYYEYYVKAIYFAQLNIEEYEINKKSNEYMIKSLKLARGKAGYLYSVIITDALKITSISRDKRGNFCSNKRFKNIYYQGYIDGIITTPYHSVKDFIVKEMKRKFYQRFSQPFDSGKQFDDNILSAYGIILTDREDK